jgi:catecholate siderophore receptor
MKHHKNRTKSKRQLFEAVLRKWITKQWNFGIRRGRRDMAHALVAHAIGTAAFIGMGATALAKEDSALLPEVVVTGRQEEKGASYKAEAVSSSKYSEPLRDIPQTITVIPQAVMKEQGATTLRDVLRNTPGISIQAGEGGVPAGDNLSIRGFSARTDLLIDGVRDFGGYSRDPFNFEQVEVTKGPSSAYAGRGSTGGSINMVSKSPDLEKSYSGTAGIGTEQYKRITMDLNQPIEGKNLEGVAVRFNVLYQGNETPNRDLAENERWGVAPSVAFGLETETRTTLSYFHMDQNNVPDYGIPWVPVNSGPLAAYSDKSAPTDWSNFYGLKDRDYEKVTTDLGTIKVEHDFSDSLSLRNQIRYGETYRDSIITSPRFITPNVNTDIRRTDWKSRDQIDTILDNQTDVTIKLESSGLEHTLVPGIEIAREKDINYTRVKTGVDSANTSLNNPNSDDPYLENIQRDGSRSETSSDTIGVYAFDTIKLNEKWELSGGLRFDYFGLDYSTIATNDAVTTNLGRIDRTTSWRSGLVYKPQENGSIYAAYGTSFNPSAEGLTLSTTATATNNFNIDPEESRTYEVGTKWDLAEERLAVNAALFRTDKTNARTVDATIPGDITVLDGSQYVQGVELGLSGKITEKWNAFAAYTFLYSQITKSHVASEVGNELSNTPQNTFSLWNVYELPANFEVGGGLQFVGDRFSSNANNRRAPNYLIGDAMAAYKFNKDITLRLNVYNVGDLEYIGSVGGGHFIPGAGRSATLTTEFKF